MNVFWHVFSIITIKKSKNDFLEFFPVLHVCVLLVLTSTRIFDTPGVAIFVLPNIRTLKAASFKLENNGLRTASSSCSSTKISRDGLGIFSGKATRCSEFKHWLVHTRKYSKDILNAKRTKPAIFTTSVESSTESAKSV